MLDSMKSVIQFESGQNLPFKVNGKPGFFCVKEGYLKVSRKNEGRVTAVRICGEQELVGFANAESIDNGTLSVDAIGGSAHVCFIPFDEFRTYANRTPKVLFGLIEIQSRALDHSESRISALSNHCLKNRVSSVLKFLNDSFGSPTAHGSYIGINIDRTTLAEMAGTIVESIARVLSELEEEGIITRIGRAIYIRDEDRLKKLAI